MEGTFTTDSHLLLAEAGLETESDESTKEVVNYLNALNASLQLLNTLPLSHRVIKKSHEILLGGLSSTRGAQKRPGEYKRDQNWIGGRTIEGAR
jgi:Fic family protein